MGRSIYDLPIFYLRAFIILIDLIPERGIILYIGKEKYPAVLVNPPFHSFYGAG